jgi:hypothetical protein
VSAGVKFIGEVISTSSDSDRIKREVGFEVGKQVNVFLSNLLVAEIDVSFKVSFSVC